MATETLIGKPLHLTVITPARAVLDADASAVVAPAFDGEVGVLSGHAPMLALLGSGELRVNAADGKVRRLAIRGGFLQVNHNKVTVLTPESIAAEEIKADDVKAELDKINATKPPTKPEELEAFESQKAWVKLKEKIRSK
ncbi:MAG TPA: ATP synthase F1 subunit epsilon [Planctomycetota bacterium]|nr:ATP synthase F1 subunit epsilon [Planctomycetota bacterium]